MKLHQLLLLLLLLALPAQYVSLSGYCCCFATLYVKEIGWSSLVNGSYEPMSRSNRTATTSAAASEEARQWPL